MDGYLIRCFAVLVWLVLYLEKAAAFITIFLAELGDKTQLATLLFAAGKEVSRWMVFLGACAGIGVLLRQYVAQHLNEKCLTIIAGSGFILVGIWTLWRA